MRQLEHRIPPPIVAILVGVAMWFAARAGPAVDVPLAWRSCIFAALLVAGCAAALAGDIAFKRARTTINPLKPQDASALVTDGIYRFTRNPMYVGMLLGVMGWVTFLWSPLALLGPVVFVAYITRFQIIPEERVLRAKFDPEYSAYQARVRRWL
jgi:protein-S-isoprenylcysteine O-methyltransferase Ste14